MYSFFKIFLLFILQLIQPCLQKKMSTRVYRQHLDPITTVNVVILEEKNIGFKVNKKISLLIQCNHVAFCQSIW